MTAANVICVTIPLAEYERLKALEADAEYFRGLYVKQQTAILDIYRELAKHHMETPAELFHEVYSEMEAVDARSA